MQTTQKGNMGETLAAVLRHPLRCQILSILATRVASPNEIARQLKEKLGDVSYHTRVLHEQLGMIELVREESRRGAVEHYYKAVERPAIDADGFGLMSVEERQGFLRYILQLLTADQGASLASGVMGRRVETHVTRVPGQVDEKGWTELAGIFDDAYERVLEVIAESAGRGQATFPVVAGLTLFEAPEQPEA